MPRRRRRARSLRRRQTSAAQRDQAQDIVGQGEQRGAAEEAANQEAIESTSSHHGLLHADQIRISGVPGALHVTHADGRPYGAAPLPDAIPPPTAPAEQIIADARTALVTLGFRPKDAQAAVARAVAHDGDGALEGLIVSALRETSRQPDPDRSSQRP